VRQKGGTLDFKVDAQSAVPVYEQIKRAIKLAIVSGNLEEGDKLMSLRELSLKLTVNPNTIIKVYDQLETDGFISSRPGAGYYVKFDRAGTRQKEQRLLRELTQEYIAEALQLGYSIEDTIKEIASMKGEVTLIASNKDNSND
jgi:GntR family transcriptional regulator